MTLQALQAGSSFCLPLLTPFKGVSILLWGWEQPEWTWAIPGSQSGSPTWRSTLGPSGRSPSELSKTANSLLLLNYNTITLPQGLCTYYFCCSLPLVVSKNCSYTSLMLKCYTILEAFNEAKTPHYTHTLPYTLFYFFPLAVSPSDMLNIIC